MAIDKTTKKKINEDWLKAFPELSSFNQNRFYKVVGPCLIGTELIKAPYTENYSPYFVIYPLWKMDVAGSLEHPILLRDFKNKKGGQYDIPYGKHSLVFDDVSDNMKRQMPLSFDGSIAAKKLLSILDEYSKTPPLSAAPNSFLQASLMEAKLKIALFVSITEAQRVLEQIDNRTWDANHFEACGVDVNGWLQSLQDTILKREEFLRRIELNRQDKKIAQLKSSELAI